MRRSKYRVSPLSYLPSSNGSSGVAKGGDKELMDSDEADIIEPL